MALIPATLSDTIVTAPSVALSTPSNRGTLGTIELDIEKARLTIRGTPDATVLQTVLTRLLR